MIDISLNLEERGLRGFVRSLQWTLQGPAASEVVGEACADLTRGHLRGLASRRHRPGLPHNFYGRAADAVVSEPVKGGAVITVPHEGLALRYYGAYTNPALGDVSLRIEDGQLVFDAGEWRAQVRPTATDADGEASGFVTYGGPYTGLSLRFEEGEAGATTLVIGNGIVSYAFERVR